MTPQPDSEECVKCILRARAGAAGSIPREVLDAMAAGLPPVEEIVERMEECVRAIGRLCQAEMHPVRSHLEHLLGKGVVFSDQRFDSLFVDRNASAADGRAPRSTAKRTARALDYGYRERLSGFVARSGRPEWDDDRIAGFIESIRHA